ncbi:MAG TPA: cupredoxin domain-containing protein, partial [Microbacterium sp.]|nr:cupredoxin domain-containing protein [Microbacterium sp.]
MSRRNWYLATNSVVLGWIVLTIVAVGVHRFVDQPLWLMVHLPLLGAVTAAILIWSQHFADTLLRRAAPGGRVGLGIRLGTHSAGALVLVAGVMTASLPLVITGAVVVAAAIIAHAVLLAIQSRSALPSRFGPLVRYYIAAAIVFLGGIAIGAVMAGDPTLTDRLVTAHLVLNAYGWIGMTALGTLVLLWPTVLHARIQDSADAAGRRALWILLAGLIIAAAGPLVDIQALVAVGMVVWLAGALLIGREGWRQARAMPPATFAGWSLACAFVWVLGAAATLAVQAVLMPGWAELRDAYLVVLGPLVAGFAVQLVSGAMSYLLPVVAMGSPQAAKAGAEVLDGGWAFRIVAFNGSILLYLLPMPSLARVLLSFIAAGVVVAFLVLVIRALVVGRRVRRGEGAKPDRSRRVGIGMPADAAPPPPRRAGGLVAAFAVLALCVAGGVAADPAAAGIAVAAPAEDVVATGETTHITVQVEGMHFTPDVLEVPVGSTLEVTFENTGTDVHDLTFANGVRTARLAPGASETIEVGVIGADMAGWCSIAGHRQMGMELKVVAVGAPAGAGDAGGAHDHGSSTGEPSAADDVDLDGTEPAAGFEPWPAALAPAGDETVHRITLKAQEIVEEVAPGIRQERWTFGGTAPGPVLRGKVGDT